MTHAATPRVRIGDIVTVEYEDRDVLSALGEVVALHRADIAVRVVGVP